MFTSLSLFVGLLAGLSAVRAQIVSGARWTDTSGNPIQAHGAGIIKVSAMHLMLVIEPTYVIAAGWQHLLLGGRRQVAQQRAVQGGFLLQCMRFVAWG